MAFPTTSVVKTFTHANGGLNEADSDFSTLGGATSGASVTSNTVGNIEAAYVGNYVDVATYGPDCEVYIQLAAGSDYFGVYARLGTPGGDKTGYQASWSGSTVALIRKNGASADTELDTATVAKSVGDQLGLECISDQIKVYTKTGAGAWTERCSATDSTYSGAGNVGFDMFQSGAIALDNMGYGTVVTGGGPSQRFMWSP